MVHVRYCPDVWLALQKFSPMYNRAVDVNDNPEHSRQLKNSIQGKEMDLCMYGNLCSESVLLKRNPLSNFVISIHRRMNLATSLGIEHSYMFKQIEFLYVQTRFKHMHPQTPIYTIHGQLSHDEGNTLKAGPKQPDHLFTKAKTYKKKNIFSLKRRSMYTQAAEVQPTFCFRAIGK